MRRAQLLLVLALALLLTACDPPGRKKKVVAPAPQTVIGTLPQDQSASLTGDATKGKALFLSNGCGGCHVYKPAGSAGKVGPDLDNLAADAKKANQGALDQFVETSIVNPSAYVESGYPDVMPKSYGNLPQKQLSDLVAFLTQKQ